MKNTNIIFNELIDEVIELGGDKAELEAWKKIWEFLNEEAQSELIENLTNQAKELSNL